MQDTKPPSPLGAFAAVWTFLTRLPWPGPVPAVPGALARGGWAFPIVGAAIGAIGFGVTIAATRLGLDRAAALVLAVATLLWLTGALHEDGLADTFDGMAGRDRDQALAIMRDSRIGTFGALALIVVLVSRFWALAGDALAMWLGACAFGRAIMVAAMAAVPPARRDGAGFAAGRPSAAMAAVALALGLGFVALSVFLVLETAPRPGATVGALAIRAAAAVTLAMLAAALLLALVRRKIGGATGDTIGAAGLIAETVLLLVMRQP